jgi:hypothetical protein
MHAVTWTQITRNRANGVSERAGENIDTLLVVRMAVRRRYVGSGRYRQFEHAKAVGLGTIEDVTDA